MRFHRQNRPCLRAVLTAIIIAASASTLLTFPKTGYAAISADPSEEIVYITGNDTIGILDISGDTKIGWASDIPQMQTDFPELVGGWKGLDLGDVNADLDLEIIAIGRDTAGNTKIAVFDPVIASGQVNPDRKYPEGSDEGIPWDVLYSTTFPGEPELIASDDFDAGIPGDEILVGYQETNSIFKIKILNASTLSASNRPSGREWKEHLSIDFDHPWTYVTSGQIDGTGSAEVVLIDGDSTETVIDVYSVDGGFARLDGKHSDGDRWRRAAVGRIVEQSGTKLDIVGIRSSSKPDKASILVYTMNEDNELSSDSDWQWAFAPQPESVWCADNWGNGDCEVFFLRKHSSAKGPRLIMRDDWGDDKKKHPTIELALDEDNGYRVGAGGDVDGDGRDEIIIARDNNIRVYRDPHFSVESNTISNYAVTTNRETLTVGDLDSQPIVAGPQFSSDKTKLDALVPIGTKIGGHTIEVLNIGTTDAVPFTVRQDLPSWVSVSPNFASTPATLEVTFDATNLSAGTYSTLMNLDSTANVTNKPYSIELALTVGSAALTASPAGAGIVYYPCQLGAQLPERPITFDVGGTVGLNFKAAVVEVPAYEVVQASLAGHVVGAIVNDVGDIVLSDASGNATTIPMGSAYESTAASDKIAWPEDIAWITDAHSITTTVPATLTMNVKPVVAAGTSTMPTTAMNAALILVADTRAGTPPENVLVVPISALCAQSQAHMPSVNRR